MELSITSTPTATPQFFAKPCRLDPEKLEFRKRNSKGWNPLASFVDQNHHGHLCTWFPKKTDLGGLVAITAVSIW
jgi:hypothetical protein